MTPVSECGEEAAPACEPAGAGCTLGAPSTWIFLVGLHLCRARLRFSRHWRLSAGWSMDTSYPSGLCKRCRAIGDNVTAWKERTCDALNQEGKKMILELDSS
jgi:hypothetical protein